MIGQKRENYPTGQGRVNSWTINNHLLCLRPCLELVVLWKWVSGRWKEWGASQGWRYVFREYWERRLIVGWKTNVVMDLDMGLNCYSVGREHREMRRDENIKGMREERDSGREMYRVEMRDKRNWSNEKLERVKFVSYNQRKPFHQLSSLFFLW